MFFDEIITSNKIPFDLGSNNIADSYKILHEISRKIFFHSFLFFSNDIDIIFSSVYSTLFNNFNFSSSSSFIFSISSFLFCFSIFNSLINYNLNSLQI